MRRPQIGKHPNFVALVKIYENDTEPDVVKTRILYDVASLAQTSMNKVRIGSVWQGGIHWIIPSSLTRLSSICPLRLAVA